MIPGVDNPQHWNRISYTLNNPIRFSDPTGHKACDEQDEDGKCYTEAEFYNWNMKKSSKGKDPKELKLSGKGRKFILTWEHHVPHLYNDGLLEGQKFWDDTRGKGLGNCTIGFGFLVHTGPCDGSPSEKQWKNGMDEATALEWLEPRIKAAEETIRNNVKVNITQSQFDALVSLELNWGQVKDSKALSLLNKGKYYEAASAIDSGPYTAIGVGYMSGLETRRHQEADMFLFGP